MANSTLSSWARTELLKGTGFANIITHIRVPDDESADVSDEMEIDWGTASDGKIKQNDSVEFSMEGAPSRTFSHAKLLYYDEGNEDYSEEGTIYFDEPLEITEPVEISVTVSDLEIEFASGDISALVWTDVLNGNSIADIIEYIRVPDDESEWTTINLSIFWLTPFSAKVVQSGEVTFTFSEAPERTFKKVELFKYDEALTPSYHKVGEIDFDDSLTVANKSGEADVKNIEIELEA